MFIHCPSCGAENVENAEFCNLCYSTLGFGDAHFWDVKKEKDFEIGMSPKPIVDKANDLDYRAGWIPREIPVEPKRVVTDLSDVRGVTGAPIDGAISYIPLSERFKASLEQDRRGEAVV